MNCLTFPIEKLEKVDKSKLRKLTKKEYKFFMDLYSDIYSEKEIEYLIIEEMLFKTFISEINKILKKNGYEKINANVTEIISEFVFCYMFDLKNGAKEYFNYFY